MSNHRALKKLSFVLYILNAPAALREDILSTASVTLLKLFCEIILNIKAGNLQGREFLKLYKAECKTILKRTHSVKAKRVAISNQTHEFFNQLSEILKNYA
jgi:hypothetical protein